jgi:acid phosphatase (class A)
MGSYTLAVVLGAIFPDKKQAFLDRAGEIAQSRVNAGVHNPNDIKEGETLGKATGDAILASPTFQKDLAEVQVELGR